MGSKDKIFEKILLKTQIVPPSYTPKTTDGYQKKIKIFLHMKIRCRLQELFRKFHRYFGLAHILAWTHRWKYATVSQIEFSHVGGNITIESTSATGWVTCENANMFWCISIR